MLPTKRILPSKVHWTYSRGTKRGYVGTRTNGTHNEEIQNVSAETEHWWWQHNYNQNVNMASAQNSNQDPQTNVVHHNHIVIKYQQPPDPAIINYVLEILVGITRSFSRRNPAQVLYTQDYINQIIPLLQTLYSQKCSVGTCARWNTSTQLLIPSIYHPLMEIYKNFLVRTE